MKRISFFTETYLLFIAIILDLLQIALGAMLIGIVLNTILSFIFYASLAIVFYTHGIPILKPKRTKGFFGSLLAEAIPLVNMLPWLTINTWWALRQIRKEVTAQEQAEEAAQAEALAQAQDDETESEEYYEEAA